MNKLLLTLSAVSLLFAANAHDVHAEGIGDWFRSIFSNEKSTDSDAKMHDSENNVKHEVTESPYNDEENYTPYEEYDSSSEEAGEQTDIKEYGDV